MARAEDICTHASPKNYQDYDVVICAGFKRIINEDTLKQSDFLNIHYSKLPHYRGLHSVVWAILNGEETVAVSVHQMTKNIDAGDILTQYNFQLDNKNSAQAMLALNALVEKNLGHTIQQYLDGHLKPTTQEDRKATWVNKRNHEGIVKLISHNLTMNSIVFFALL